jgi:S-adenosylmethionine-diacylglycerol 3-amino-3-carboxypropyl transferase
MAGPELKFAVVREDPRLEEDLVRRTGTEGVLLVASGGCTALHLLARFPKLRVVGFDFNPAQLEHVREKAGAAQRGELRRLNVKDADRRALNQRGAFEGLFRGLRGAIAEFVAPEVDLEAFFAAARSERAGLLSRWTASRYWPAAFQVAFADGLLHAMFGPAATQHAAPGSYPGYFQRAFERGLAREDAAENPFLQHVLLGRYLEPPLYAAAPASPPPELLLGTLLDVPDLGRFGLVSLSNVFDWSDDALVVAWADKLRREARPGCVVLIRQLNNQRNLRPFFPGFRFDDQLGRDFLNADRSLFYERFEVAFREGGAG